MCRVFCLNPDYSTTRCLTRDPPSNHDRGRSKLGGSPSLNSTSARSGAGGLRTQGYFKLDENSDELEEITNNGFPKKNPIITVITVVFNGVASIEKTILSVINQSFNNIEYIVIDGGSTDGTCDIIRKYEHAIDYWVTEPDEGIYDAWNKGLSLSCGKWIAFLGADDVYLDGAIQAYVTAIINYRGSIPLEYISSQVNLTTNSGVLRTIGRQWNWKAFRKYMNVAHVGSLHSRELYYKYGLYDISYKICGDYEFLLRAGSSLCATYLDTITVDMRVGGVSDSNILVFQESATAKIKTGKRNPLVSNIEKIRAFCQWKLRTWLWY